MRLPAPPPLLAGLLCTAALATPGLARAAPDAAGGVPPLATAAAVVAERAGCRECHNAESVASDTRFVLLEAGSSREAAAQATAALLELVDRARPADSRLLRKPTRRMLHEGGQKIAPGSADERTWTAWVTELAAESPGRTVELAARVLAPEVAGTSKPADTSPTARGLFVREHLLCQKVPTPPAGVNMNLPPPVVTGSRATPALTSR